MKALYLNRLCSLVETSDDVVILAAENGELSVSMGSPDLVLDPTDSEVAAAENLGSWYSVESVAALRALLTGERSTADRAPLRRD